MNYRHIYHAGNFADVFKHWILTLLLENLCIKDTPFFVLDTHAGVGEYPLSHTNAKKTMEYATGVEKILAKKIDRNFKTYIDIIKSSYEKDNIYLGSPRIIQALLRSQDRLFLTELHREDFSELEDNFKDDRRVKVLHENAYTAIKALLPPLERRGLILIDPPFEQTDEFTQVITALQEGLKRFANGIYALWYPIKEVKLVKEFYKRLNKLAIKEALMIELYANAEVSNKLSSCGMIIINPPWKLEEQLRSGLPKLLHILDLREGRYVLEKTNTP